ncbi:transglycosylase SLT domain-containing protein [Pseudoalteromonas sp. MMG022]|uniref:transglycosylase SLT domain-containing protein n=1 Tax=Pseudoalteromonas sp. MMG022 TaxID=2909978 RepID=UPI001F357FAC|nr:transglycosylase SLT domain-containing protein [Pseudoalteromonas sp. MMG022]MCF6434238.1 transglycosylase SLT domain-containing protein [Pseudoalteromonas sp. MMG022]
MVNKKQMLGALSCLTLAMASGQALAAQSILFSELNEAMSQWQSSYQQTTAKDEFEQFKLDHLQEFDRYVEQHFWEYDKFRNELISSWGEAQISEQARFVQYNQENNARLNIDFENNTLTISVRHSEAQKLNSEDAYREFQQLLPSVDNAVLEVFFQDFIAQIKQADFKSVAEYDVDNNLKVKSLLQAKQQIKQQTEQQLQVVERQLDDKLALPSDPEQQEKTKKLLKQKRQQLERLQTKRIERLASHIREFAKSSPPKEKVSEFTFKLTEHAKRPARAKNYVDAVAKHSERFDIAPSLVFSVMHTESHFNPLAKSAIPAFGLMQIVPSSAGVDVNRFLYNRDEPMPSSYLYIEGNNIEAGTAYLHILDKRYLKHISDPLSRKYCMIAAYNTGAGNVARVFNSDGSRNIRSASRIINSMTPARVLEALEKGLPYDETKHYLKRVLEREPLYQEI